MTGRRSDLDSKELSIAAAEAASDKKAEDIVVLDVAALLVVTDYFVICTGRNDRQVKTIADEVEERLRTQFAVKPIGREGVREARWILLDFADVVVHIFQPEERDFYRLEKLWGDAPRIALPEEITGTVSVSASVRVPVPTGADAPVEDAGM